MYRLRAARLPLQPRCAYGPVSRWQALVEHGVRLIHISICRKPRCRSRQNRFPWSRPLLLHLHWLQRETNSLSRRISYTFEIGRLQTGQPHHLLYQRESPSGHSWHLRDLWEQALVWSLLLSGAVAIHWFAVPHEPFPAYRDHSH